jgi:hypothetical protein
MVLQAESMMDFITVVSPDESENGRDWSAHT